MADRPPGPAVFVHVGEPKSGTTFLQDIMWGNRTALARQGVLLPGASAWEQFRATQDLREVTQSPTDPAGSWKGEWDLLARQARQAERVAVISHEMLVGASADQAERAVRSLQPADVHIVVTLRDFASLLPAEWQETIKHRNSETWERWLELIIDPKVPTRGRGRWFWRAHDTERILQGWAAHVPPDHVHVITMPRAGASTTLLWERFASVLGIDPGSVDSLAARPNASLGLPEVELLRRLNTSLPGELPTWFYSAQVKDRLAHQVLADRPKKGRLQLPPSRREWAAARAEELITALGSSGYDIVGDLDELRPVPPRSAGVEPDDVTDAEVLDAAIAAIGWMLQDEYTVAQANGQLLRVSNRPAFLTAWRVGPKLRDLSARYPLVGRLRVILYRIIEAARARRGRAS